MSATLLLKVVPNSSRDTVAGWLGDALKVRVRAAPERGKANAAVERLLAKALDMSIEDVSITAGMSAARKRVEITGLSEAEVRRRLEAAEDA